MKHCKHCNQVLGEGTAAHRCKHGFACRYATDEAGDVIDWLTLECPLCTLREAAERVLCKVQRAPQRERV